MIDPKFLPQYKTEGAANVDLIANISKPITLYSNSMCRIDTGIKIQLPAGWKAEISVRSGWGKKGLIVTNAPGQVDEDYTGPIILLLCNAGDDTLVIEPGDRIAQMWPAPVYRFQWVTDQEFTETQRGENGFGSTGLK